MGLSNYVPNSRISQAGVCTSTTRPATPYEGQVIFETDTNRVLVWDASAWVMIADTDQPPAFQLIKTVSVGTGVSSVDVTNVFDSTFDNYRIAYSNIDASVNATGLFFRFGTAASPVTTNYRFGGLFSGYTGTNLNLNQNTPGYWEVAGTNTDITSGLFDVCGPNLAAHSTFTTQFARTDAAFVISGIHVATTQHTAFHLYPLSGTLTGGTIHVYGYRI